MQNFEIRRPRQEDQEAINVFFSLVIGDTYAKEGLGDRLKDIQAETETKKRFLQSDLSEELCRRHFLIALDDDKVIGSIEYGSPNEIIRDLPGDPFKDMVEIGSVFVHPLHQRQGVGSKLLQAMFKILKEHGIDEFCLDSGYTKAKQIWRKKFGEPAYILKDYWGQGFDHFVWYVRISELI
jgi:GNAT superfamily N-acetyltransferase